MDEQAVVRPRFDPAFLRPRLKWIFGYLAVWAAAVAYLSRSGGDATFPFISLGVIGVILPAAAWLITRGVEAPKLEIARPGRELGVALAWLAFYAFVVLGWAMGPVRDLVAEPRLKEATILAFKLLVHVAIPAGLLLAAGARPGSLFDLGLKRRGFWRTLLVFGAIVIALQGIASPALRNLAALAPTPEMLAWGVPLTFAWLSLEAGLCEEFLFRVVLQSRLAVFLRTETGAIVLSSLLFGLAHAPGLYLRGGPGIDGWSTDPVQVAAYTIATLSPFGILFGVLWARTRSLLLIVLLHGAVDFLPHLAPTISLWGSPS